MTPTLDPAIAAYLPGAVQALFAVASFVVTVVVVMLKVQKWMKAVVLEFSRSPEVRDWFKQLVAELGQSPGFRAMMRAIADEVVRGVQNDLTERINGLEKRDEIRASTQRKLHEQKDELRAEFVALMRAFSDHRQWTADGFIRMAERKGEQ